MSTAPLKPTYLYKLIPSSSPVPEPYPERLPVSDLDQKSGFIHLSTAYQVPNTLKHFFSNDDRVYIVRIGYDDVGMHIRWEDPKAEVCGPRGGEGMFPHLYNGLNLGKKEIDSVQIWERHGGTWDEAIRQANSATWLVY